MIIIVGAGPAGLALAYYAQQRGLRYEVVEQDRIGRSWRSHYDSLSLHTLKEVSGLPGLPMPERFPTFPTKDDVVHYLEGYAAHFGLNVRTGVTVQRAERSRQPGARAWRLDTTDGELTGDILMAATGIWSTPVSPTFPGQDAFGGTIVHSNAYQSPDAFRGQSVLVVGVGNSGAEISAELGNAGVQTAICIRDGAAFVPYPTSPAVMNAAAWFFRHVPEPIGNRLLKRPDFSAIGIPPHPNPPMHAYPVVGFELPAAVKAGLVTVYPGIETLTPTGARFVDGRSAEFDVLLLATGYRPTLDYVTPHVVLGPRGWPKLDAAYRSRKEPLLYCVGFDYPATSGWLQNIGRVANIAISSATKQL